MGKFSKKDKKKYTVLIPSMLDFHMQLFKGILEHEGFTCEILKNTGPSVIEEGLKYVHNDICYPALLVIGQILDNLKTRKDKDKVAVMITQTGGGCRASNYMFLLKKALSGAGYKDIPILSVNFAQIQKIGQIGVSYKGLLKVLVAMCYGDMLMYLNNKTRSYEINKGDSANLTKKWVDELISQFSKGKGISLKDFKENAGNIAKDYDLIPVNITKKPRVGIVGEIYIKYSSLGNNHLEDLLVDLGAEICVPGLMGFIYYCAYNFIYDYKIYKKNKIMSYISQAFIKYLDKHEAIMIDAIKTTKYEPMQKFETTKDLSEGILEHGTKMGEGWLLTAEMVELIKTGYENIICAQPFGCLPNHICGKGVMKKIKEIYPFANIVAIDYDPSATRVNQENRIKLMLSIAKERKQTCM